MLSAKEIISERTGISTTRLNALYRGTGSRNADELLLIEMAIGEQPGFLFEKMYGGEFKKKVIEGIKENENKSKKYRNPDS